MAYQISPFVDRQLKEIMSQGGYPSEEDVLRNALRALKRRDANVRAVKEAIADMEAGDEGVPFDQFVEDFRREHQLPLDA